MSKHTNYGLGVACVVFLVIACWYGSSVIGDLQSWQDWDKPAEVAKMWKGLAYGGIGFLLAMGVNFFEILRPVLSMIPGLNAYVQPYVDQAATAKDAKDAAAAVTAPPASV